MPEPPGGGLLGDHFGNVQPGGAGFRGEEFPGLVGGIVGIIIGAAVARIRSNHPIDLSMWAKGYEALGYDAYVYLNLDPTLLINVAVMVIITGVIAALYPAYKALKNDPADALRIE